jgi:hypothetical protein
MESNTISSESAQVLIEKIDVIHQLLLKERKVYPLSEKWLDIQETCLLLKLSKRTLQSYRDNGLLSFSQIGGKIYFKVADLEEHLKNHYVRAFSSKKNKRHEHNSV